MADLTKKEPARDERVSNVGAAEGESTGTAATIDEVRADAEAARPLPDELQKKREALADAGLAHASLNNYQPMAKEEFSEAERQGDTARTFPDNVSEATKRANKQNDEAVGGAVNPGQPAVGSAPLRDPGRDSEDNLDLPEDAPAPQDVVPGSGDENAPSTTAGSGGVTAKGGNAKVADKGQSTKSSSSKSKSKSNKPSN